MSEATAWFLCAVLLLGAAAWGILEVLDARRRRREWRITGEMVLAFLRERTDLKTTPWQQELIRRMYDQEENHPHDR